MSELNTALPQKKNESLINSRISKFKWLIGWKLSEDDDIWFFRKLWSWLSNGNFILLIFWLLLLPGLFVTAIFLVGFLALIAFLHYIGWWLGHMVIRWIIYWALSYVYIFFFGYDWYIIIAWAVSFTAWWLITKALDDNKEDFHTEIRKSDLRYTLVMLGVLGFIFLSRLFFLPSGHFILVEAIFGSIGKVSREIIILPLWDWYLYLLKLVYISPVLWIKNLF